jgi:hypothetical protein
MDDTTPNGFYQTAIHIPVQLLPHQTFSTPSLRYDEWTCQMEMEGEREREKEKGRKPV